MSLVRAVLNHCQFRLLLCVLCLCDLPLGDDLVDGLRDAVGVVVKTNVAQHHGGGQDQGSGVSLVLALDVETDVTAARLENGDVTAHVASRNDTGATDKAGTDVGQDTSVQVGHHHNIELLWPGDALHGGVVDNHVVGLESGVVLGDLVEGAAEKTIGKLHDVGLVDASNLGSTVGEGEREGELGDTLRLGAGDDLEGLNDTLDALVLETRVLTLGVLSDDAQVDVLVAGLVAGDVLDQADGSIDVKLLSHGDVETLVAGSADGGVKDTLETELVALKRSDRLAESILSAAGTLKTGNLDLLPLNGDVVGLEDGLDRLGDLGTDTITGDEGDGVLAAELGRLEDVGLDGGEGSSDGLFGDAAQQLEKLAMSIGVKFVSMSHLGCCNHCPYAIQSHTCCVAIMMHAVTNAGIPPNVQHHQKAHHDTEQSNIPEPNEEILETT